MYFKVVGCVIIKPLWMEIDGLRYIFGLTQREILLASFLPEVFHKIDTPNRLLNF